MEVGSVGTEAALDTAVGGAVRLGLVADVLTRLVTRRAARAVLGTGRTHDRCQHATRPSLALKCIITTCRNVSAIP